ncbi:Ig-like domain-containing protein [Hahella sp. HN01]|uniref:Ig-like domain-containing protein n=1 Tax=Hahella sp. HN01 TaxID=2847262 RepID=UPI001C1EBD2E|nr:Ig-like domain-containing protein [Hahella sp. HN01]MBU6952428.1 hypothetical protein [Hahella sp. HN01]
MFKKTFLSLAVASAVTLSGCGGNGGGNANAGAQNEFDGDLPDSLEGQFEGKIWPLFNPIASLVPVPNDLLLDQTAADGTFSDSTANPVLAALGSLSGASTIAPIDISFSGELDGGSLSTDSFISSGGSLVPNPNQNVFLLELAYASGEPIQGLTISEPPTIPLAAGALLASAESDPATAAAILGAAIADAPAIKASVIELSGASTLRIQPTKPLKPKTRYLVIVTNEVEDATGQAISMDPNYYLLTGSGNLPSSQLEPVRTIINSFWEPVAETYFTLNNTTRSALSMNPLSVNNIALTYSFTTSGDEKVMEYIANPAEWFNDQLTGFIRISAAKAVITAGTSVDSDSDVDYSDIKIAADAAVTAFPTTAQKAAFSPIFSAAPPFGCDGLTGATAIGCAATALTSSFSALLPTPKARTVTNSGSSTPVNLVSALTSSLLDNTNGITPMVSQGTIGVPYYLGVPSDSDGSTIQSSTWTANKALADALNTAFSSAGLALPQGDTTTRDATSSVVNYVFPFPQQTDADTTTSGVDALSIPWLAIYPNNTTDCPPPLKTVIFQHGITTDRSAALSIGTALAEKCFATIAIDQVVHGVAPASTAKKLGLAATLLAAGQESGLPASLAPNDTNNQAVVDGQLNLGFVMAAASVDAATAQTIINSVLAGGSSGDASLNAAILALASFENTVANAGSTIPGIAHTDNERHFDYTANAAQQAIAMNFDPASASGSSGSLFINLTGFINSRDKNRQGVIDLLNLRQTISSIDLDGDGTDFNAGDLDNNNVFFMGHSLGTLIGTPFVAVANSTPMDNIKAAALLTPASGIVRMLENSPSFAPTIIGGLSAAGIAQGTTSYETFLGVFQAALDAVDPISFADNLNTSVNYSGNYQTSADDTGVLIIELAGRPDVNGNAQVGYISDQTNVIETETTQLTTSFGTPYPDLLSGVDKLAEQMGATNTLDAAAPSGSPDTLISRLSYGSHAMYVLPIVSSSESSSYPDVAAETKRRQASFAEGVTESIAFFTLGGEISSAAVDTTAALAGETTGLETEANYQARTNKQLNLSN